MKVPFELLDRRYQNMGPSKTLEALVVGHMLVLDFLVGGFWDKAAPISLDPLLYVAGFTSAHLT